MLRVMVWFWVVWAFVGASAAVAQTAFGEHTVFDTRFGQVQAVGGDVDNFLWFNGRMYDEIYGQRIFILGGFGLANQAHDWVLIRAQTGGNGCFPVHQLIRVSQAGLSYSEPFGHCAAEPLDVRVFPGRVEMDLSHPNVTIARETFGFDGPVLTSTQETITVTTQPAGPGAQVMRWIGQHPHAIFDDFSERARFETIMPAAEINALANHVLVANSSFRQGDWVIGQGCMPHQCNVSRGLWALRISDGAAAAAIMDPNGYLRVWGLADRDPVIQNAIAAHRP